MLKKNIEERYAPSHSSQSYSNLHQTEFMPTNPKNLWLRKSIFNPQQGLDQLYASRNHIPAVDVPLIEVIHSSRRWLLLQSPKFSRSFFNKLNQGKLGNPYEQILRVFKGFVKLIQIYGYFRPTYGMIFLSKTGIKVWIDQDIFANQPFMILKNGLESQKEFILAFLNLVQNQMTGWERTYGIFTIEKTLQLLEERSRQYQKYQKTFFVKKQTLHEHHFSNISFNQTEGNPSKRYLKPSKSVKGVSHHSKSDYFREEISNSVTIQEEVMVQTIPKTINKLLCDSQNMKYSINEDVRVNETAQEVRRTKKKFNLTSTSSTLQKFSEKLHLTIGKKALRQLNQQKKLQESKQLVDSSYQKNDNHKALSRSEPITIANELEGLFEQDIVKQLKLGIEGNRQQLQKIAQQIEEVLTW